MKRYEATYVNGSIYKFNATDFFEAQNKAHRHTWVKLYKLMLIEDK